MDRKVTATLTRLRTAEIPDHGTRRRGVDVVEELTADHSPVVVARLLDEFSQCFLGTSRAVAPARPYLRPAPARIARCWKVPSPG